MACRHVLHIGASLMLLTLAFQVKGSNATISASGTTVNPSIPNNRRQLLVQAPMTTVKARRRTVIKNTFTSNGDAFGIGADQQSDTASAYLYLFGYNNVSTVSSDNTNPNIGKQVAFSFFACQEVEPVPGDITISCTDTTTTVEPEDFNLSIDPKTLSATASATFSASTYDLGTAFTRRATVSFYLTFPGCSPANITRSSSVSSCNEAYKDTYQPTTAHKSKISVAGTQCQMAPDSITGVIVVNGVDLLSTLVKSPDALTAYAYTTQNKKESVDVTKYFLL